MDHLDDFKAELTRRLAELRDKNDRGYANDREFYSTHANIKLLTELLELLPS